MVAHNKFSDRTLSEMGIQSSYTKFSPLKDTRQFFESRHDSVLSSLVNWCDSNCAEIQDQKADQCSSSGSFATVAAMETMISIQSKLKVQKLSEQECVSCAYGQDGCTTQGTFLGFDPTQCLNYGKVNMISPAEVYPYSGTPAGCQSNLAKQGCYLISSVNKLDQNPSSSA